MRVEELDTPVLVVDLDGLEDNLRRYQEYFTASRISLRPHIKTHKCLAIAHAQLRQGATGITCQKLGEPEVMVAGGVQVDTLIPYNVIGTSKLERLVRLARQVPVTVAADSDYTVDGLAAASAQAGVTVGVVVELGRGRTGVSGPVAARDLARRIHASQGLSFRGIMVMPSPPEVRPLLQETLALLDQDGLPHPMVSGGSTPASFTAHLLPELTEHRAGEYCVGGMGHLLRGTHSVAQCALRVVTTVVSRPAPGTAILDAGSKALSASVMQTDAGPSMGYLVEYPQARLGGASEEHGHVDVSGCAVAPQIGERVQVLPVHPCPCVNEHDQMVAVRGGEVVAIWPVHARGRLL